MSWKYAIGLAVAMALTLTLGTLGTAGDKGEDKDKLEARKDVLEVLKLVEAGKDDKALAEKATAIKKKDVELNHLMLVYKLKEKGGLGYGENPDPKSGIEAKIIALQRTEKGPAPATIKKEAKDLIKLAHVNIAMAEIARPHFIKPMDGKNKKDWDGWLEDQKKAARELIDAVKASDGKGVSKAAKEMLAACTDCHAHFRK